MPKKQYIKLNMRCPVGKFFIQDGNWTIPNDEDNSDYARILKEIEDGESEIVEEES